VATATATAGGAERRTRAWASRAWRGSTPAMAATRPRWQSSCARCTKQTEPVGIRAGPGRVGVGATLGLGRAFTRSAVAACHLERHLARDLPVGPCELRAGLGSACSPGADVGRSRRRCGPNRSRRGCAPARSGADVHGHVALCGRGATSATGWIARAVHAATRRNTDAACGHRCKAAHWLLHSACCGLLRAAGPRTACCKPRVALRRIPRRSAVPPHCQGLPVGGCGAAAAPPHWVGFSGFHAPAVRA
jgi:hypothetical protein